MDIQGSNSADITSRLGTSTHYNGIFFGDITAVQADCEGALAIGGTAKFGSAGEGYDVGAGGVAGWESVLIGKYDNPNDYPTLLLGGAVSDASTNVRVFAGDVFLKNGYKEKYESQSFHFETDSVRYEVDETVDEFFAAAKILTQNANESLLKGNSKKIALEDLSILKSLKHSDYIGDNLCTDKRVLVYTVDCGPTDSIRVGDIALGSYIKDYDTIVINIPAKKITFTGGAILYNGAVIDTSLPRIYAGNALIGQVDSRLIFNFPNATEVKILHYGVIGAILAPDAAVTGDGGSHNGMLIADSLYQSGGMELHAFTITQGEGVWEYGCAPPTGSVTIQKLGDDDKGLAGADFSLYAYAEATGDYTLVRSGRTDEHGLQRFDDLPIGRYKLVETKPPQRYILPDQHEWIFELTESDEGEVRQLDIIYIKNTLAKGCVTLYKLDFNDREIKLADAVFSLYGYNEITGEYDDLIKENLITDEQGVLTVDDLLPGKYKLVETHAPDGYYLSQSCSAEFEIKLDDDGGLQECELVEIFNQKLASVEVVKRDSGDTEITLEGAVFTLYRRNEETGEYEEESTGWTTDNKGELTIPRLEPGHYKLVETKAPKGYYLPQDAETEFSVECDEHDRIIDVELINITNRLLGKIQFYKIDSENDKLFLEGAEFVLYRKDSGGVYVEYRTGLVSGSDGGLLIEELEPGEYKLVETKPPHGYLLPENPDVEFTIAL